MTDNDPLIGTQLGDYQIADVIGHGGMGRVYRGFDEKLERYAAVKVFDAKGFKGDEMEEYRARFQREARAIARLHHPNIVNVYQFGQTDSLYYMAMVLIDGQDLRAIIKEKVKNNEQIKREAMLRIVSDVALALDYAHSQAVIHRDVKPSNIMVMEDGHAVLTDFGLVLNVPEGTIGTTFGSVHYIAPEQAMNSAMAVPQSDMYSLGIVLYEMLTGRVPFDDQSAMSVALKHLSDPPPPPRKYNPDISPELEAVVLRALDKDPERRYPDGNAFVQALENAFGMVDEDEHTRRVVIPDWAKEVEKTAVAAKPAQETHSGIPLPVIASGEEETISERSSPFRPGGAGGNRIWNLVVIGATVLVVLVGILLLTSLGENDPGVEIAAGDGVTATEPPTDVPTVIEPTAVVAVVSDTDTPTDQPTEAPSSTPTSEPTDESEPTQTATTAPSTATKPPTATPRPSATPTNPPTMTRTPRPASSLSAPLAPARLIYDSDMFLLINDSADVMDVSGIVFVQVVAEGNNLTFPSSRWNGGGVPTSELPPGDCFQIFTTNVIVGLAPSSCNIRHKWDQTAFPRWFWVSEDPDTRFEVRRSGVVLAVCRVGDGECVVDLYRESED